MNKTKAALLYAVAAVAYAMTHDHLAEVLNPKIVKYLDVVAVIISVLLLIMVDLLADLLYELLYVRWAAARWVSSRIYNREYFEGWWLDVGIDESGGVPEIKNYSFIDIHRDDDRLIIDGYTWGIGGSSYIWNSIAERLDRHELFFAYSYVTTHRERELDRRGLNAAAYIFDRDQSGFVGQYDGGAFGSFGTRHKRNNPLLGNRRKLPEEANRERLARKYKDEYMSKHGFDKGTHRQSFVSRASLERKDWFISFVKASNAKAEEVVVLKNAIQAMPANTPRSKILDLGPGDGTLTVAALRELKVRQFDYLGIESNGILAEEAKNRLQSEIAGVQNGNVKIEMKNIDEFIEGNHQEYDLIMALHCMYFVSDPQKTITKVLAAMGNGGIFLAMHTDFTKTDFVSDMLSRYNNSLKTEIVQLIEKKLEEERWQVTPKHGGITLPFPELSPESWARVRNRGAGEDVAKTIELISFILDRGPTDLDPGEWEACVEYFRTYLSVHDSKLVLPVVAQICLRR